jgi:hypothetical protein
MTLVICLLAIRAASLLVPGALRSGWRRAWVSEVWHYARLLRTHGVKNRHVRARIRHHTMGAIRDAWRLRSTTAGAVRLLSAIRKPGFALGVIGLGLAAIAIFSHGLARTRAMLLPQYPDAGRLVLISEKSVQVGGRHPISPALLEYWKAHNTTLAGLAGFKWDPHGTASITPDFFDVLGVRPRRFLLHRIREWKPVANAQSLGVLGRLKPGVEPDAAEADLRELAARQRYSARPTLEAQVIPLVARMRQPLYAYGTMCALTAALLLAGAGIGIRADRRRSSRVRRGYWAYFCAKAVLLPLMLALLIWEFSRATSFTITGEATFIAEPFFIWLVILAAGGMVWWTLADQRVRCRACLQVLRYPVRIGSLGAVLFDHAGVELVCCEGHGSLYVPAVSSDYVQSGGWTGLDSMDIHSETVRR